MRNLFHPKGLGLKAEQALLFHNGGREEEGRVLRRSKD